MLQNNTHAQECHLFVQDVSRENPNQEEELTTPGFGNDLQNKYEEFRNLELFTDLTLNIENKSYKVYQDFFNIFYVFVLKHDMLTVILQSGHHFCFQTTNNKTASKGYVILIVTFVTC